MEGKRSSEVVNWFINRPLSEGSCMAKNIPLGLPSLNSSRIKYDVN
jgi:hypothetical protein